MKELITFVLKPLSFLPALAIMYIIYSFSGQTGEESGNLSYEVSVKIVEIGNQVLDKGLQDWEISEVAASIEYPVRKLAHMKMCIRDRNQERRPYILIDRLRS